MNGHATSQFDKLQAAFQRNFDESGEIGARVCVIQGDEIVVDLWDGFEDEAKIQPWHENTLVCCMSVTKGVVALCAHLLHSRGLIDYDAPLARYWPEFAANGKADITVRQAMSHQASLAIIDDAEPGDTFDWDKFVGKIANQSPNWDVATNETYHSVTIGYITGELVRRVDGRDISTFIREELTDPLDADYILGCSDEDMKRVVPGIPNPDNELMNGGLVNEKTAQMYVPLGVEIGSDDFLKSVFPSGGGVSHAEGLARLFAPLANGGSWSGKDFFEPDTLKLMVEEQWFHDDYLFGNDFRVALGLLLHTKFNHWGRDGNIGTAGGGGYGVFADPENKISFAYTPNRFTSGYGLGNEFNALVDAMYECL